MAKACLFDKKQSVSYGVDETFPGMRIIAQPEYASMEAARRYMRKRLKECPDSKLIKIELVRFEISRTSILSIKRAKFSYI